jgi:hypothetical protein
MKKPARNLHDYRLAHDPNVMVPAKIKAALVALAKEGAESWEYEAEFIKRAGIAGLQLSQFRDQFAAHIVEAPSQHGKAARRVYFGTTKAAAKARGED